MSRYAPYAVVLDCVGGKDVMEHMNNLVLHDPKTPELGIYVTIVGDSMSFSSLGLWVMRADEQKPVEMPWEAGQQTYVPCRRSSRLSARQPKRRH